MAALGDAAVAGVGAAGTVMFVVMAITQALGVGSVALIAQAVGRKDRAEANLVFNQSLTMAAVCMVLTQLAGYTIAQIVDQVRAAVAAGSIARRCWSKAGRCLRQPSYARDPRLTFSLGISVSMPTFACA